MPTSSQALQQLRTSDGVGTDREPLDIGFLQIASCPSDVNAVSLLRADKCPLTTKSLLEVDGKAHGSNIQWPMRTTLDAPVVKAPALMSSPNMAEESIRKAGDPFAAPTAHKDQIFPAIGSAHAQTGQVVSALAQASKQRSEDQKERGVAHRNRCHIINLLADHQALNLDKENFDSGQNHAQHNEGLQSLPPETGGSAPGMTDNGFTKGSRSLRHNFSGKRDTKVTPFTSTTLNQVSSWGQKPAVTVHPPRLPGFYSTGILQSHLSLTGHGSMGREALGVSSQQQQDADCPYRPGDGDNIVHLVDSKQTLSGDEASEVMSRPGGACGVLTINRDTGRHEWKLLKNSKEAFPGNAGFRGNNKRVSTITGKQALPSGLWVSPYEKMERQREELEKIKFRSLPSVFDLQLRMGKGVGVTGMLDVYGKHIQPPRARRPRYSDAIARMRGQPADEKFGDPGLCPRVLSPTDPQKALDPCNSTEEFEHVQEAGTGSCFNMKIRVSGRRIPRRHTSPTSSITPRIVVGNASPEGLSLEERADGVCATSLRDGNLEKTEAESLLNLRDGELEKTETESLLNLRDGELEKTEAESLLNLRDGEFEKNKAETWLNLNDRKLGNGDAETWLNLRDRKLDSTEVEAYQCGEDGGSPDDEDKVFSTRPGSSGVSCTGYEVSDFETSTDTDWLRSECMDSGRWRRYGQVATLTQPVTTETSTDDAERSGTLVAPTGPIRLSSPGEKMTEIHGDGAEGFSLRACALGTLDRKSPQPKDHNLTSNDVNRRILADENVESSGKGLPEGLQSVYRLDYIRHLVVPDPFPKNIDRFTSSSSSSPSPTEVPCKMPVSVTEAFSGTRLLHRFNPAVLRMRKDVPPSDPNKLCFQSNIPGCTHAEILQCLETAFPEVRVASLQYDPVYLQDYRQLSFADLRFKCMWLFTLDSENDPSSLVMRNFRLRGQRMYIRRADDVYAEEQRAFKMCWEMLRRGLVNVKGFKAQGLTDLKQKDPRDRNAGNISASNVYRTAERKPVPNKGNNQKNLSQKHKCFSYNQATFKTKIQRIKSGQ